MECITNPKAIAEEPSPSDTPQVCSIVKELEDPMSIESVCLALNAIGKGSEEYKNAERDLNGEAKNMTAKDRALYFIRAGNHLAAEYFCDIVKNGPSESLYDFWKKCTTSSMKGDDIELTRKFVNIMFGYGCYTWVRAMGDAALAGNMRLVKFFESMHGQGYNQALRRVTNHEAIRMHGTTVIPPGPDSKNKTSKEVEEMIQFFLDHGADRKFGRICHETRTLKQNHYPKPPEEQDYWEEGTKVPM
jgi:hypothetical protein